MSELVEFDVYPDFPEAQQKIETLNLPQECYSALKRTGVDYVGDALDLGARIVSDNVVMDGAPRMRSECYLALFRSLINIYGCPMRDEFEKWLEK